jgi:hypothetical protein
MDAMEISVSIAVSVAPSVISDGRPSVIWVVNASVEQANAAARIMAPKDLILIYCSFVIYWCALAGIFLNW